MSLYGPQYFVIIWLHPFTTSLNCTRKKCYLFPAQWFSTLTQEETSVGLNQRSWWSRSGTGILTSPNRDVVLSADSAPAAAGPGWALSGHDLVSAGWPAGPRCKIPVPGKQTQTETNAAAAAVRLSWESKADLYNNTSANWTATRSAWLNPLYLPTTWSARL